MSANSHQMLRAAWTALELPAAAPDAIRFVGAGDLPSYFATTDLAAASVGAAALAVRELIAAQGGAAGHVSVDRRLASLWFGWSIHPVGWERPPLWDAVAGDYPTADGWIRLHTNAPHHRDAALAVLGCAAEREAVARVVAQWRGAELEEAVVGQGGCAAAMRSMAEWAEHPQGRAVAAEPLIAWSAAGNGIDRPAEPRGVAPEVDGSAGRPAEPLAAASGAGVSTGHAVAAEPFKAASLTDGRVGRGWSWTAGRPLAGLKVLDLTRVLAGPVATRFLAGYGADVLRIDPPGWNEPGVIPEVTLGKRCARLDLALAADRAIFESLLAQADVLVHGYRPAALERLGFGEQSRRRLNPGLIDVALDAYGWTGPLAGRRGFDSLVQMSCGIAHHGMQMRGASQPVPLPVQALDHATGYLVAAAAVRALIARLNEGRTLQARLSLARTAKLLVDASAGAASLIPLASAAADTQPPLASAGVASQAPLSSAVPNPQPPLAPAGEADLAPQLEPTEWGPARRLHPPAVVEGAPMRWDRPAASLGSSAPRWDRD